MKIQPKFAKVGKFQQGGAIAPDGAATEAEAPVEEAPVGGEGQDPMAMIAEAAAQALQANDCQTALQVCQAILEMMQQMQGGAPAEDAGEPVYRQGGVLAYRIKK